MRTKRACMHGILRRGWQRRGTGSCDIAVRSHLEGVPTGMRLCMAHFSRVALHCVHLLCRMHPGLGPCAPHGVCNADGNKWFYIIRGSHNIKKKKKRLEFSISQLLVLKTAEAICAHWPVPFCPFSFR